MQIDETKAMKQKREQQLEQFDEVRAEERERESDRIEAHFNPACPW